MIKICLLLVLAFITRSLQLKNWTFTLSNQTKQYPATIPSTLSLDLMENNLTSSNPYFRDNILQYYKYETLDTTYRTSFPLPSQCATAKIKKLIFEGLDTHCDVYLNGKNILTAHNMFRKYELMVELETNNKLQVRFNSSANYDVEQQQLFNQKYGFNMPQNFSFSRKAAYQYGWDWGPRILTVGIWKPVNLQCFDHSEIKYAFVQHEPITKNISSVKANITAHFAHLNPSYSYSMVVKFIKPTGKPSLSIKIKQGLQTVNQTVSFEESSDLKDMIWWTNDLGSPNLFIFSVTLVCESMRVNLTKIFQSAFRTVTLKQTTDQVGTSFTINLNGYDLFIRGGNYIPPQMSMARVPLEKYQETRENAVFGRYNMIRVWGGGQFEHDEFYEQFDRAGILVWHDLMYACALYPIFSQGSNIDDMRQQLIDNVIRIRNHPSMGIWNGNNEVWIGWQEWGWKNNKTAIQQELIETMYKQIFHQMIPEVLNELTPSIPYWQTSPSVSSNSLKDIGSGDIHFWRVWAAGSSIEEYEDYTGRFNSQYGMQSMPNIESIQKFTNPQDRQVGSFILRLHERHPMGDKYLPMYTSAYAGNSSNLMRFAYFSQVMQAYALETAIRSLRGNKPVSMGSLYWQMNDVWPVSSWATIDYYNSYKAAHYRIRQLHSLIMIHALYDKDRGNYNIYIVNDKSSTEFTFSIIEVLDFNGTVLLHRKVEQTVVGFQKVVILRLKQSEFDKIEKDRSFISMKLDTLDKETSENNFFFVRPSQRVMIDPSLTLAQNEETLTVKAEKALANYVWIRFKNNTSINFEDNFFDLLPGTSKQLTLPGKFSINDLEVTSYQNERLKEQVNPNLRQE